MLIQDFHRNFKIGLDKIDSLGYPDILPEEIDVFLNNNILKFINQRLYGNNPRGENFEETQKRFDDLITLVKSDILTPIAFSSVFDKPNSATVDIPTDYLHMINEEVDIQFNDCNNGQENRRIRVIPITHDKYNDIIKDPFNKPNHNKVIRLGYDNKLELISSTDSIILFYYIRYIRKPASVRYGTIYPTPTTDVQCDLPESVHQEILDLAILDCLEKIESQRLGSSAELIKQME